MRVRKLWSRRFIEVLESLGLGSGLDRGRRDARAGVVLSMSLSTSVVVGQVQGTEATPYRVRIGVKALNATDWSRVEAELAASSLFTAKLLAGELPHDIEKLFSQLDLQLFPGSLREMSMDCSCPDWEVPCRHLAAVCSLLADSFDADPFQILAWRGRNRADLLTRLRTLRTALRTEAYDEATETAPADGIPLADSIDSFWTMPAEPAMRGSRPTTKPDALLDQLEPLTVELRGHNVVDLLRPAYRALAELPAQE
jgi:uncharacterized Zn finger protein